MHILILQEASLTSRLELFYRKQGWGVQQSAGGKAVFCLLQEWSYSEWSSVCWKTQSSFPATELEQHLEGLYPILGSTMWHLWDVGQITEKKTQG